MTTLKEFRQRRGYSNVDFCNLARISPSTLSRMENGKAVSKISAGKACRALGITLEDVEGLKLTDEVTDEHPAVKKGI